MSWRLKSPVPDSAPVSRHRHSVRPAMKRYLLQPLIKGSMVVIPLLVTIWLLWSALLWLNSLGSNALTALGIDIMFPGLGLIIMLLALLLVGMLFQLNPVTLLSQCVEDALLRFRLVRALYGAVTDSAAMLANDKQQAQAVVRVDMSGPGQVIGFITATPTPPQVLTVNSVAVLVAVFL